MFTEEVTMKVKIKHGTAVAALAIVLPAVWAGGASAGSSVRCPESKACGSAPKAQGSAESSSNRLKAAPQRSRDPWGRDGFRSGGWYME